jgi:hypothetical protein
MSALTASGDVVPGQENAKTRLKRSLIALKVR